MLKVTRQPRVGARAREDKGDPPARDGGTGRGPGCAAGARDVDAAPNATGARRGVERRGHDTRAIGAYAVAVDVLDIDVDHGAARVVVRLTRDPGDGARTGDRRGVGARRARAHPELVRRTDDPGRQGDDRSRGRDVRGRDGDRAGTPGNVVLVTTKWAVSPTTVADEPSDARTGSRPTGTSVIRQKFALAGVRVAVIVPPKYAESGFPFGATIVTVSADVDTPSAEIGSASNDALAKRGPWPGLRCSAGSSPSDEGAHRSP